MAESRANPSTRVYRIGRNILIFMLVLVAMRACFKSNPNESATTAANAQQESEALLPALGIFDVKLGQSLDETRTKLKSRSGTTDSLMTGKFHPRVWRMTHEPVEHWGHKGTLSIDLDDAGRVRLLAWSGGSGYNEEDQKILVNQLSKELGRTPTSHNDGNYEWLIADTAYQLRFDFWGSLSYYCEAKAAGEDERRLYRDLDTADTAIQQHNKLRREVKQVIDSAIQE